MPSASPMREAQSMAASCEKGSKTESFSRDIDAGGEVGGIRPIVANGHSNRANRRVLAWYVDLSPAFGVEIRTSRHLDRKTSP